MEKDLQSIKLYDDMDEESGLLKLEKDYKTLSVYNYILKEFAKELSMKNLEGVYLDNPKESIKIIRTEIRSLISYLVKFIDIVNKKANEDNNVESKCISKDEVEQKLTYPEGTENIKKTNKNKNVIIFIASILSIGLITFVSGDFLQKKEQSNIEKVEGIVNEVMYIDRGCDTIELIKDKKIVTDKKIRKNYYLFDYSGSNELTKFDLLVDKRDYTIYLYDDGFMFPYVECIEEDGNPLESYFSEYFFIDSPDNIAIAKKLKEEYSMEEFYNKVKAILEEANEETLDYFGSSMAYVNAILSGSTKEELDSYVY